MANEDLIAIMATLEALRHDTRARMNATSDREESDRLFLQVLEINHRLQMLNFLLFKTGTEALTGHVEQIAAATEEVRTAIDTIDDLAEAIEGIKAVLGLVDTVIDIVA